MLVLDYNNVEDLVFGNVGLIRQLPHLRQFYDQWKLSKMTSALRPLGQKAKVDFLRNLTDEDVGVIKKYLQTNLTVSRGLDYRVTSHFECSADELQDKLNALDPEGHVRLFRDGSRVYVSIWR